MVASAVLKVDSLMLARTVGFSKLVLEGIMSSESCEQAGSKKASK